VIIHSSITIHNLIYDSLIQKPLWNTLKFLRYGWIDMYSSEWNLVIVLSLFFWIAFVLICRKINICDICILGLSTEFFVIHWVYFPLMIIKHLKMCI
jgi:hypothetical protein